MKRRTGGQSIVPSALPQNPTIKRTIRYSINTGGTVLVYRNCLLSLIAALALAGNSNVIFLIQGIRVRRLQVWSISGAEGNQQLALVWGTSQGPSDTISAVGNLMFPARIDSRPPAGSYASMWQMHDPAAAVGSENDLVFEIVVGNDVIIDLEVEMVLEGNVASNARLSDPATGVTTTTAVGLWYLHLDSLNAAGSAAGSRLAAPVFFDPMLVTSRTP
jgi:hypothetical protein